MIAYSPVGKEFYPQYDAIPMLVHISSYYRIDKIDRGLGGLSFAETPVKPYVKDLGAYESATGAAKKFDMSNWAVFMAFDKGRAVGGAIVASRTEGVNLLSGRGDIAVLWDLRVDEGHKRQGIGQGLFGMAVGWCRSQGLLRLKIECQNNNVPACKFYHKQGAALSAVDEYAYSGDPESMQEAQFVWFLDL
jgi:GNAT superfamily N-acetyltransferase